MLQLDEKKFTREHPMLARLRERNWQTPCKKTHLIERNILFSIFSIWRKKISTIPVFPILDVNGNKDDIFKQN